METQPETDKFRVLRIERGTTVDGPGFRTSIYFAGCAHRCPGCHNPQSWDFSSGHEISIKEIVDIVKEEEFDVTLTGGDPLYQPEKVSRLVEAINAEGFGVWIYTGFTWEEIIADSRMTEAVVGAEAVVEGRFIKELRDESLPFRGSSNQRIIYPGRQR